METTLVTLRSSLCFLLEIDNLPGKESVALVTLIVFCQLAIGYAEFVGKAAEGVALAYLYIIVAIKGVDGMEEIVGGMVATVTGEELVIGLGMIVAVELIELDNLYQFVGIAGIGGIASCLESACPSLVVGLPEREEFLIALAGDEESGVILVALVGIVVGAETFALGVVVMIGGASCPTMALDADDSIGTD